MTQRFAPRRILLAIVAASLTLVPVTRRASAQANPVEFDIQAPALAPGEWLNTPGGKPISLAALRGKVTILHFWTFGCINCQRNLPSYQRWQQRFAPRGVTIIGVHTPETADERDPANVRSRVKKLQIAYPVLIDGKLENWSRWGQRYWPTVWLIDKRGHVRYRWEGELEWKMAGGERWMSEAVEELLREPAPR